MLAKKRKGKKVDDKATDEPVEAIKIEDSTNEISSQSRLPQPKFSIGDSILLCISEVRKDYLICNYIRNKKAIIHSNYCGENTRNLTEMFKVGDFVPSVILASDNQHKQSTNRKLVCSIDPKIVNSTLKWGGLAKGMDLWGRLGYDEKTDRYYADLQIGEATEEDDFEEDQDDRAITINLDQNITRKAGDLLFFKAVDVRQTNEDIIVSLEVGGEQVPVNHCAREDIRPGFLFKCSVGKELENGSEVSFAAGGGGIFTDHNKKGNAFLARVILVTKDGQVSLSARDNVKKLITVGAADKISVIGKTFENVKLEQKLFGGSFACTLGNKRAYIHSKYVESEAVSGQFLPKVAVKEYNFFDDRFILTNSVSDEGNLNWHNLKVGYKGKGVVKSVGKDYILVHINDFLVGKIPSVLIEGLKGIPKHIKAGKEIQFVVFEMDFDTKNILLTTKKEYISADNLAITVNELKEGDRLIAVYKGKNIYQHSGMVQGLLVPKANPEPLVGSVCKVIVSRIENDKILFCPEGSSKFVGIDLESVAEGLGFMQKVNQQNTNNWEGMRGQIVNLEIVPRETIEAKYSHLTDFSGLFRDFLFVNLDGKLGVVPRDFVSDFCQSKVLSLLTGKQQAVILAYSTKTNTFVASTRASLLAEERGFVSKVISDKRLQVTTTTGAKKVVKAIDASTFTLGQTVSFSSKGDKLSLDYRVNDDERINNEAQILVKSYFTVQNLLRGNQTNLLNTYVEGRIDKAIDFGYFLTFGELSDWVGFLKAEHSNEELEVGFVGQFTVIDVDCDNKILYISSNDNISTTTLKAGNFAQFTIELIHDNYISLSATGHNGTKAILPINSFNKRIENYPIFEKLTMGEELNLQVISKVDGRLLLRMPEVISDNFKSTSSILTVNIGDTVIGKINSIKEDYIFLRFARNVFGRVSIKFFTDSQLTELKTQDATVSCNIVNLVHKNKRSVCECVPSSVDLSKYSATNALNVGLISSIYPHSKYPVNIYFQGNFHNLHFSALPLNQQHQFNDFFVGQEIECYFDEESEKLQITSFKIKSDPEKGCLVVGRVTKLVDGRGIALSLGVSELNGFVDLTEISDDLHAFPTETLTEGQIVLCRVLTFETNLNKYFVTLRESLMDDEAYRIASEETAYKFAKYFAEFETKADYRLKLNRFGYDAISPNLVLIGFISASSEKGVFIKLSSEIVVRANTRELVDENILKPFLLFKPGQLAICRVVNIKKDQSGVKINVSLRESVVKHNVGLSLKKLDNNLFYYVYIAAENDEEYQATVIGTTFSGKLKKSTLPLNTRYPLKSIQVVQISKIDKTVNPVKIVFSTNTVNSSVTDQIIINSEVRHKEDQNEIFASLYESVMEIVAQFEREKEEKAIDATIPDNQTREFDLFLNEDESHEEEEEEAEEQSGSVDLGLDYADKQAFFEDDVSMEEAEEPTEEAISNNKLVNELKIRQIEEDIEEREPTTFKDFENAILSNPDDSITWIKYASYALDKNLGVKKASEIFDRALQNISLENREDRLKIWIAKINLENEYGDEESLKALVTEAINTNDKMSVLKHLVQLFKGTERTELTYEIINKLRKTYFEDVNLWKIYLEFLFENQGDKFENHKEGLKRCLQVFTKLPAKAVELRVAYANLLYRFEQNEEGQNEYENILQENPKKLDIWLNYAAKEIKSEREPNIVRKLFEKALRQDWSTSQTKKIFKYFLNFEKKFGTDKTISEAVKKLQKILEDNKK